MRKTSFMIAALTICAAVFAMQGGNGYVATPLFSDTDLVSNVQYPTGFAGIPWGSLAGGVLMGGHANLEWPVMAAGPSGDLFVRIQAGNNDQTTRSGVVRWDGTGFQCLVQDLMVQDNTVNQTGAEIDTVVMAPATSGLVTAGHPVAARFTQNADGSFFTDFVSFNFTGWPVVSETLVHRIAGARILVFAVGGGGSIFYMAYPGNLHKLTWQGSGYADSVLTSGLDASRLCMALGTDGAVYAFPAGTPWGQSAKLTILRIDPVTGAQTPYATVSGSNLFKGMFWDGSGNFWMGLTPSRQSYDVITSVLAGRTVSPSGAIVQVNRPPVLYGWVGAPGKGVFAMESTPVNGPGYPAVVYKVVPGSGGGKGK